MKVRISVGESEKLSGHLNIDPITKFDDVAVDIRDISEYVDDASCESFVIDHVLGFLEKEEAKRVFVQYMKKIRHEGTITVSEIDAYEIARSFYKNDVDIDFFNKAIHGNFEKPWDVKLSSFTIDELIDILREDNFQITKKRLNGARFTVEAIRP